jgi:hypothetical protein
MLDRFAENSIRYQWDDNQTRQFLGDAYHYDPDKAAKGVAGDMTAQMKKISSDYLVPISDETLQSWSRNAISGRSTADDFRAYAEKQARSMFPSLNDELDRGLTVQEIADPYRQQAAQILGIDPTQINFADSKWRSALDHRDKDGKRSTMTLSDWTQQVRTDPRYGYDRTQNAVNEAASLVTSMRQIFTGG